MSLAVKFIYILEFWSHSLHESLHKINGIRFEPSHVTMLIHHSCNQEKKTNNMKNDIRVWQFFCKNSSILLNPTDGKFKIQN